MRSSRCAVFLHAALIALAVSAFSPTLHAQETSRAAALIEDGTTFYKAHEYRRAAEKFVEASSLDPDPNLVYNIAKCYEALGDTAAAIEKYEAFLAKPGGDSVGRSKAEASLKALKKTKEAPAAKPAPVAPEETPPAPAATEHKPPYALMLVTFGVGVAAGTVGTIFYVMGSSDHNQVTSSPGYNNPGVVDPMSPGRAQDLVDSGNMKKTVGVVGIATGGAAVAASAVIYLLTRQSSGPAATTVGFAPTPSGGAMLVQGAF